MASEVVVKQAQKELPTILLAYWEPVSLAFILVVSLALRLVNLTTVPTNITADEADFLQNIYHIKEGTGPGLFGLDWSQHPAFSVYLMTWAMHLFGWNIPAMRMTSVILSTLALVPFYLFARQTLSRPIDLAVTFLMAMTLWYLNFSRSGWINSYVVLYQMGALWLLSEALRKQRWYLYAGAGVFAALGLYAYEPGRLIILGMLLYLPFAIRRNPSQTRAIIKGYAIMTILAIALFLPQTKIIFEDWEYFTRRATYVSLLHNLPAGASVADGAGALWEQAVRVVRGFILGDGSVIGGAVVARYSPQGQPILDAFTATLFLIGLVLGLFRWQATALWWIFLVVQLFFTQVLTIQVPDIARGIGLLPMIYLFVGLAMDKLLPRGTWYSGLFRIGVLAAVPLVAFINTSGYFEWVQDPRAAAYRQPAVEVAEFEDWQSLQMAEAAAGRIGFNVLEWQKMRGQVVRPTPVVISPRATPVAGVGRLALMFGEAGSGPGQFSQPRGVAVDSQGNIYVADAGNKRIQKFDPQGKFLLQWGKEGKSDGEFVEPSALVVDGTGVIYVLDSQKQEIQKFDGSGKFTGKFGADFGTFHPRGLTIDGANNLYIADTGRNRVLQVAPTGQISRATGGDQVPANLSQPTDAVADGFGGLYVAEPDVPRIQRLDASGRRQAQWSIEKMDTVNGPHLAMHPSGLLVATEPNKHRVTVYSSNGVLVGYWGSQGAGEGQFQLPTGVAVDKTGRVYVADTLNNRIQVFTLSLPG